MACSRLRRRLPSIPDAQAGHRQLIAPLSATMTQPLASLRYKYRLLPAASPSRCSCSCSSIQTCHSVLSAQFEQCCSQWLAMFSSMLVVWQWTMSVICLTTQLHQHQSRSEPLEAAYHHVVVQRPSHLQTISQWQHTARPAVTCSRTQITLPLDAASPPPRCSSAPSHLTWASATVPQAHHVCYTAYLPHTTSIFKLRNLHCQHG